MTPEEPTTEELHSRIVQKRKELRKLSYAELLNNLRSVWYDGERREQHTLYRPSTDETVWDDHVLERACWDVFREWNNGKRGPRPGVTFVDGKYVE